MKWFITSKYLSGTAVFVLLLFLFEFACTFNESSVNQQYKINPNGDTCIINFSKNKLKLREVTVKRGKLNGPAIYYFTNGKICKILYYSDGKKSGNCEIFYSNGILKSRSYYKNDMLSGKMREYYSNGALMSESVYENDTLKEQRKFTNEGHSIKDITQIEFSTRDSLKQKNLFKIYIKLNNSQANTQFYLLKTKGKHEILTKIPMYENYGILDFKLKKGEVLSELIFVVATYTSKNGKELKIYNTYNLEITN